MIKMDSNSSNVVKIADLIPQMARLAPIVIGVCIAKNSARSILDKRGEQRHVFNFTIRDSDVDTINCSCWGDQHYVQRCCGAFVTGEVVEIKNPIIQPSGGPNMEAFKPVVSSKCQLMLSEPLSTVVRYVGSVRQFATLMNVPLTRNCPITPLINLATLARGENINLLVAVKKVGMPREFVSKDGKPLVKSSVTVFDQTLNGLVIDLWDSELINFAKTWTLEDSGKIVLIQDVKVGYDNFRKCGNVTANSKTVFTLNPHLREAQILFIYAMSVAVDEGDDEIDLNTIQEVLTVSEIEERLSQIRQGTLSSLKCIVYASLTTFDLDGPNDVTKTRCSSCKRVLDPVHGQCINMDCSAGAGAEMTLAVEQLDFAVGISDPTGTLSCRLQGRTAAEFVGHTVKEFQLMNINQKTAIKWKHLLEWKKWHIHACSATFGSKVLVKIVSGQAADIQDMCNKLAYRE